MTPRSAGTRTVSAISVAVVAGLAHPRFLVEISAIAAGR
jgi:enamine deaminase RidA (YjgF/YER057c/UK114 family)